MQQRFEAAVLRLRRALDEATDICDWTSERNLIEAAFALRGETVAVIAVNRFWKEGTK